MDWDQIQGNWKQFKGVARERWGQLTTDDLDHAAGGRDRLEGVIQERYGRNEVQARREVDGWIADQN